jgi:VanZ family protein
MSSPPSPPGAPDWLLHAIEFGVLSLLLSRALAGGWRGRLSRRGAALTVFLGVLYGAGDEWHQSFISGRDASGRDLVADGAGTLLGLAVTVAALRWRPFSGGESGRAMP